MAPRLEIPFVPGQDAPASRYVVQAAREPATPPFRGAFRSTALGNRIYATREGLVGFTTANGHVIQVSDRFVALPSRRALNRTDKAADQEFTVELSYGDRTVRLPVWDVGPWNTKDDWWNDASFRQTAWDTAKGPLPTGTPQAQAAYLDGYNQGMDGSGRKVKNPAGIDLADGAFWNDLGLTDNAYIQVRPLWRLDVTPGRSVRAVHWTKVRATPGGKVLDSTDCGEAGMVVAGPDSATVSGHWYLFYQVEWNGGAKGWSAENFLSTDFLSPCAQSTLPRPIHRFARLRGGIVTLSLPTGRAATVAVVDASGRLVARSPRLQGDAVWSLPPAEGIQFVEVRSGTDRQILTRLP